MAHQSFFNSQKQDSEAGCRIQTFRFQTSLINHLNISTFKHLSHLRLKSKLKKAKPTWEAKKRSAATPPPSIQRRSRRTTRKKENIYETPSVCVCVFLCVFSGSFLFFLVFFLCLEVKQGRKQGVIRICWLDFCLVLSFGF